MRSPFLGSATGLILMLVGCAKPAPVPPVGPHGDCPCSDKDDGPACAKSADCQRGAVGPMMVDGGMMHHGDMMHHGGPMMADGGMGPPKR